MESSQVVHTQSQTMKTPSVCMHVQATLQCKNMKFLSILLKGVGSYSNHFAVVLCHGLVEMDGSNQVIVKVAARVANAFTHSFETREMDHSIKPVYLTRRSMKVINFNNSPEHKEESNKEQYLCLEKSFSMSPLFLRSPCNQSTPF